MQYDSTYIRYLDYLIHRDRKWNGVCQGLEEMGDEILLFMGYGVYVPEEEKNAEDWLQQCQ